MEAKFLGPLGKVTGSCTWMRDTRRGWSFLVDCGMQQGEISAAEWNRCNWPFDPSTLEFVVLTHAHIDHCGLLPMLYKHGFTGTVYCPSETRELAIILLKDAARLSNLYSAEDVDCIKWHEHKNGPLLGGYHPVGQDLFLRYFRTGHILGAVSVVVCWGDKGPKQRSIVFSGDLGPAKEDHEHLPFLRHRMNVGTCDFAVVESTYGAKIRSAEELCPLRRRERIRSLLERILETNGTLLIPAFSLGRTQDVLFDLHWVIAESLGRYDSINFCLDSPTAIRMHPTILKALERTESNGKHRKVRPLWLGKQMFRWFGLDDAEPTHIRRVLELCAMTLTDKEQLRYSPDYNGNSLAQAWRPMFKHVKNRVAAMKASKGRPTVVVASAGSCDGGPAAAWLLQILREERNNVALTGYCAATSVGGELLELSALPPAERRRHMQELVWPEVGSLPYSEVRAGIEALEGYSAHADQSGLLDWLFQRRHSDAPLVPAAMQVFIQHGENSQRRVLANAIKARGMESQLEICVCEPSDPTEWFDLELSRSDAERGQRAAVLKARIAALQTELEQVD
ncbi:MAG: MBL fold metallo-hydrolase [Pseudomonadaceae bacterium]